MREALLREHERGPVVLPPQPRRRSRRRPSTFDSSAPSSASWSRTGRCRSGSSRATCSRSSPATRTSRLDDDHRVRLDIPQANTLVVERGRARAGPALPDPRARRQERRRRPRLPLLSRRAGADAGGPRAARDARRPHRARQRLRHRHARPGDPRRRQPARRRAVRPRGGDRLRALRRAPRGSGRRAQRHRPSVARPVRVDAQVDAYVPTDYMPAEAQKIDLHRRLALAESEDELRELRAATEDRFGPLPEPVESLFAIQEVKLKLARIGADYLVFRSGRAVVGPLVLGSASCGSCSTAPIAVYSSAKRELTQRGAVPRSGRARRCYPRFTAFGLACAHVSLDSSHRSSRCARVRGRGRRMRGRRAPSADVPADAIAVVGDREIPKTEYDRLLARRRRPTSARAGVPEAGRPSSRSFARDRPQPRRAGRVRDRGRGARHHRHRRGGRQAPRRAQGAVLRGRRGGLPGGAQEDRPDGGAGAR